MTGRLVVDVHKMASRFFSSSHYRKMRMRTVAYVGSRGQIASQTMLAETPAETTTQPGDRSLGGGGDDDHSDVRFESKSLIGRQSVADRSLKNSPPSSSPPCIISVESQGDNRLLLLTPADDTISGAADSVTSSFQKKSQV